MLVLWGFHVPTQLVGGCPELLLKAKLGLGWFDGGIWLDFGHSECEWRLQFGTKCFWYRKSRFCASITNSSKGNRLKFCFPPCISWFETHRVNHLPFFDRGMMAVLTSESLYEVSSSLQDFHQSKKSSDYALMSRIISICWVGRFASSLRLLCPIRKSLNKVCGRRLKKIMSGLRQVAVTHFPSWSAWSKQSIG